jgi:1,4-alpha-glucan branching enzyme
METKNHERAARADKSRAVTQTFFFSAPSATSVQLAGDFTHWQQQAVNMHKGPDGIWRTKVELSPGTHHYRFLVDGEWRDDPECSLRVRNPYGTEDSVRRVA